MGRIETAFSHLKRQGKRGFIPFITAGDPDLETTRELLIEFSQAGATVIAGAGAAEKARKLLAPQGLDALRGDLDAARAREHEASTALAQLPEPPGGEAVPSLDGAEGQHRNNIAQAMAGKFFEDIFHVGCFRVV